MSSVPTIPNREHLDKFFSRVAPVRSRLIFAIDGSCQSRRNMGPRQRPAI
jgi:hypothetical protein